MIRRRIEKLPDSTADSPGRLVVYNAGIESYNFQRYWPDARFNVLLSYFDYIGKGFDRVKIRPWMDNIIIDSGAYSAYTSNKPIDIGEYKAFLFSWGDLLQKVLCINLDVIGDSEASYHNYRHLKRSGLPVLPVFHFNEPFEYLKRYAKMTDYICLGGLVGIPLKRQMNFLSKVFEIYPDRTKVGFHGLGIMNDYLVNAYPWRSVDSSTAMGDSVRGKLRTPYGVFSMNRIKKQDIGRHYIKEVESFLSSIGVNWDLLIKDEPPYTYHALAYISLKILNDPKRKIHEGHVYKKKVHYLFGPEES